MLGDASSFTQLQFLYEQALGQQQLWNLCQRQLARVSAFDPEPRAALRRAAARLRAV